MEIAAGEYGYDADYFRRMLGGGRRRRSTSGRYPLRGHHRFSTSGGALHVSSSAALGAHGTRLAYTRVLRSVARSPSRIFSRSCSY